VNVLVTGATGFVGRRLVARLLETRPEDRLTALVLPDEAVPPEYEGRVRIVRGDLREAESVRAAVAGQHRVFHLAAVISYLRRDGALLEAVNRDGVASLVDACLVEGVGRLVHVSSVGAVGFRRDGTPAAEDEPFNWPEAFAYMRTKREGQRLVEQAVRERSLDAVIVCPASVMGPGDPSPRSPHNRLYRDMFRRPLFVGTLAGGLAVVDVRDVVDVVLAAADRGRRGDVYLAVGANVPYSRVLSVMAAKVGRPFVPLVIPPVVLRGAGWLAEATAVITKGRPLLTEAYGRLSGWRAYYSNEKSCRELGVTYRRLEDTIGDGCDDYAARFLTGRR